MQNELEKGILRYVDSSIENAPYTQIYTGLIKASDVDGYTIDLNGVEYTNVLSNGTFSTNDTVRVVVPNNQFSNMFILSESTGSSTGAVSSVNGMTGDVVISNVANADKLSSAKTITLSGDATGSVSTDLSTNPTISVTVVDDSHNHIISNVDGLQTVLDGKSNTGHTHGTFDNNTALTNGTVYSNIQITDGIVTAMATKTLTTSNIEPTLDRRYVPAIPEVDSSSKFLNGDGSFTSVSIGGSTSSGNIYFSNLTSDIATYLKLTYDSDVAETTKTVTVNNTAEVLSHVYLYDSPLGIDTIDAGIWKSTFNVKVSNAVGETRIKIVAFTRETTGVETDLFTRYTDEIPSTSFTNIYTETNRPQFSVSPTARLGFRIYGSTDSAVNIIISYNIGGVNGSYINSPLALRHSQLRDKDGETAYQHITSTVKTDLTDGGDTILHYHATDRNRANHTGTQTSSTISNFASTVRSTVLTGLSTATNAIISATDTVLSALGKLQAQITANLSTLTTHIGRTDNPHSVTKTQVGLGNVADVLQYSASNPQLNVTGSSGSCTGNSATATKLATARTINGVGFDGTANITIEDSTKLPLSGGTLTGGLNFVNGTLPITWEGATYRQRLNIIDDSTVDTNVFEFQQSTDAGTTYPTLFAIKDNGNVVTAGSFIGALIGNSSTTTKLQTAHTISLTGDVTGSVNTDFSTNPSIATTVVDNSHNHNEMVRIDLTGQTLDLNTLTLSGGSKSMYYVEKTDGGSAGITNMPISGKPFILDVQSIRYVSTSDYITLQTFFSSYNQILYYRQCVGGVWDAWKSYYTSSNKQPDVEKLTTARTISLTGDVTGSVSFDGSANVSITSTVVDDSHNHVISNVDNLQTTLDSKLNSSVYNATDVLTKIKTVDGSGSGLDADTVDTYHVDNTLNTGSLWTSDKILSTVESYGSHFDIVQYSGTYAVNDILTMTVPTITSNKSTGIEVLLYRNSVYESALLGIDYTYKYTSATQIQVQFFTAGTYIANYGFYNVGSWILEWQ